MIQVAGYALVDFDAPCLREYLPEHTAHLRADRHTAGKYRLRTFRTTTPEAPLLLCKTRADGYGGTRYSRSGDDPGVAARQ